MDHVSGVQVCLISKFLFLLNDYFPSLKSYSWSWSGILEMVKTMFRLSISGLAQFPTQF